jgi:hypothetical protein
MAQAASMQQEMFSKIRDWQQSGLTQKGWCKEHQIKYHVFHYWYKLYRSDPSPATQNEFIALQIQPAAGATCGCLELILADGKRLLFHQPVSTDYLKALIS